MSCKNVPAERRWSVSRCKVRVHRGRLPAYARRHTQHGGVGEPRRHRGRTVVVNDWGSPRYGLTRDAAPSIPITGRGVGGGQTPGRLALEERLVPTRAG